jgi:hypothetical protein
MELQHFHLAPLLQLSLIAEIPDSFEWVPMRAFLLSGMK